ncbi:MAG: Holliday junction branch migration protein RuvA [Anaerolineae bacterium]|nr:Holliday junction branch migration protein RuvA [Anaerolineae bacterium]
MIHSIEGEVIAKEPNGIVLNVQGFGILVYTPLFTAQAAEIGQRIFLHTHFYIRENIMALYGFAENEERKFFLLFNDVNGIGPKAALAILSTLSLDAIRNAILAEEYLIFSRVPGIGRKTAEKILLHLKDKISPAEGYLAGGASVVDAEVVDALTALGYSVVEAQRALQSIPRDASDDIETRLRIALQHFGQ